MSTSFAMTADVIQAFPTAQIRFVIAEGMRNAESWTNVAQRLEDVERRLAVGEWHPYDEEHPSISSWHAAYRRFGSNPKRFRPSLDALSRRLTKGGRLPRINSAVDAYNLTSVLFGTPAGAFDLDRINARVSIRPARADDTFVPLGEPDEVEQPTLGEIVYARDTQVLTRRWNHRDCDQTKVTQKSTNVVFIIERVSEEAVTTTQIAAAQEFLADLVRPHADSVRLAVIEAETPLTNLEANEPGLSIVGRHS